MTSTLLRHWSAEQDDDDASGDGASLGAPGARMNIPAMAVAVHGVIEAPPQGQQTKLAASGAGLAGDQRQRIRLARALLKNPKFLILDEVASNLDQETAEGFARTVNALKARVTMLFITYQVPREGVVNEVLRMKVEVLAKGANEEEQSSKI